MAEDGVTTAWWPLLTVMEQSAPATKNTQQLKGLEALGGKDETEVDLEVYEAWAKDHAHQISEGTLTDKCGEDDGYGVEDENVVEP